MKPDTDMDEAFGIKKKLSYSFEVAVAKIRQALQAAGFGIITEIDVRATLKNKLNVDFTRYVILGACNPILAYKALKAELDIGLMLPCNVIVYEEAGGVVAAAMKPSFAMKRVKNKKLSEVSEEAESKLRKAIEGL